MRHGKSGITKRSSKAPPVAMKELRISIKEKTAKNILTMNSLVSQKVQELNDAQANLQNHVVPLLTERNLPEGARVVQVTEKAPWELVVMVPKK